MAFKMTITWEGKDSETPGRMHYKYTTFHGEMVFDFDLFCFIGEPYQPFFRVEMARRRINVKLIDDTTGYYEAFDYIGEPSCDIHARFSSGCSECQLLQMENLECRQST